MRRKAISEKKLNLGTITGDRIKRLKRAAPRRFRASKQRPNIGLNVTVMFRESGLVALDALEQRAVAQSRRCGPRHSTATREASVLTKTDLEVLRKAESEIIAFLAAKPEHAALFTYDPFATLKLLEKPLGRTLLTKLRTLNDAGGALTASVPNVRIGRIKASVVQDRKAFHANRETIDPKDA